MNRRITRFYPHPIFLLNKDRTVAYPKTNSYTVVISEEPLLPGELFLVDIELNGPGHLQLGLFGMWPNMLYNDVINCRINENGHEILKRDANNTARKNILGVSPYIRTPRGLIPKSLLLPSAVNGNAQESRIGFFFVPTERDKNMGDLYFIINGVDQGPIAPEIPLNGKPLHVVMRVHGATKEIRVVQLESDMSLQAACKNVILENIKKENIDKLPLPTTLKAFLRVNTQ